MSTDLRHLYWPGPFRGLYQQLQAANAASEPQLRELLSSRQEWLLLGLSKFQPPREASRKTAQEAFKAGKLVLVAPPPGKKGGGQRVTLDARMEQAALELSAILVGAAALPAAVLVTLLGLLQGPLACCGFRLWEQHVCRWLQVGSIFMVLLLVR